MVNRRFPRKVHHAAPRPSAIPRSAVPPRAGAIACAPPMCKVAPRPTSGRRPPLTDPASRLAPPRVRDAHSGDVEALAVLKRATFRETFLDDFAIPYPPADIATFEAESYAATRIAAELTAPAHRTWVAEAHDGALLAYAHVGPCKLPHPDLRPGEMELYQLYVRRTGQGMGLGRELLATAMSHLGDAERVWLGVWSGNTRAQAIYAARGFRPVGTYRFPVGAFHDDEIIMRRDPPQPGAA